MASPQAKYDATKSKMDGMPKLLTNSKLMAVFFVLRISSESAKKKKLILFDASYILIYCG